MNEKINKNFFKTYIVPLIFVGLYIVIQYVGSLVGIVLTQGNLDLENIVNPALTFFIGQFIALVAMIALLIPYLKKRKQREAATVLSEPVSKDKAMLGILWGFVGIGVMIVTNIFLQPLFLSLFPASGADEAAAVVETLPLGLIFLNYLNSAVLAPIAEELTFRHGLLGALKPQQSKRRFGIYLYTALLFAATHLDITQILAPTFLGILLANVYVKTRSIWPAIIAHGVINALMGATLLVLPEAFFGIYLIGMAVLAIVATAVLIFKSHETKKTETLQAELA